MKKESELINFKNNLIEAISNLQCTDDGTMGGHNIKTHLSFYINGSDKQYKFSHIEMDFFNCGCGCGLSIELIEDSYEKEK